MDLIAKGNTAEVFQYSDNKICKLFYLGYPKIYIEHEYENAKAVCQLGIKTPMAHKLVCVNGREGIIYDQVDGEELSSKMYGADEEKLTNWMGIFVSFHKELLEHQIDNVMDYKDFLKMFAADSVEMIAKINKLEDGNCLLHGDFHPGNVMVDADERLTLIDMMNGCKGPTKYDIARTYFLLGNDKKLQNKYLELMGCELKDIMSYLEVISLLRKKELES